MAQGESVSLPRRRSRVQIPSPAPILEPGEAHARTSLLTYGSSLPPCLADYNNQLVGHSGLALNGLLGGSAWSQGALLRCRSAEASGTVVSWDASDHWIGNPGHSLPIIYRGCPESNPPLLTPIRGSVARGRMGGQVEASGRGTHVVFTGPSKGLLQWACQFPRMFLYA